MGASPADSRIRDLGKYRLIAELAHGGMGVVYLAVVQSPTGFSKLAVVKVLRSGYAQDPQFLTMFLDEARLASRLNHSNVVQTFEVGVEDGKYFIAMEYLEGQSLQRILGRLNKPGELPLGLHVRALADVCAGLHYAHELTDIDGTPLLVVHRDATPHNVFVTYDGQVKIVDFGIAKAMNASQETRTGVLKGKVSYMAPEQAEGTGVDRRTDVFAVGVMLFEAVTGRRLWQGIPELSILHHLATGKIPRARDVNPDVPPELDAICSRALSFRKQDRYATAQELQAALEDWLKQSGDARTLRELGQAVTRAFADERAKVKLAVENQLRRLRQASPDGLPDIEMVKLSSEGSQSTSAPSLRRMPVAGPANLHRRRASKEVDPLSQSRGLAALSRSRPSLPTASPATSHPRRGQALPWILATLLVCLVTIALVAAFARSRRAPQPLGGTRTEAHPTGARGP